MEKKTIRSGAPFLMAGLAVLAYAVIFGVGTLFGYLLEAGIWVLAFAAGKKLFPDRVVEVERAAQSGNAEVDELIAEARTQLAAIRAANDAIAEPELSAKIDGIESTCRQILARLEEQPQMLSSLRTFLRYYLPATMKLLDARAKIEGEVRMGANAQIAQRIREAMEDVYQAFEKQLEALNDLRFINLESEMDALSAMLAADGLTAQAEETMPELKEETQEEDPFAGLFTQGGK
ncbi:MAG: 5-bromo-4-chloroindolyl phosphate hydrolysis family protein [Clostridia bacterium]|nr:5-bromo-4-chloroindolyl phosphate hydrolysis family protein [Clostridia bacterium]